MKFLTETSRNLFTIFVTLRFLRAFKWHLDVGTRGERSTMTFHTRGFSVAYSRMPLKKSVFSVPKDPILSLHSKHVLLNRLGDYRILLEILFLYRTTLCLMRMMRCNHLMLLARRLIVSLNRVVCLNRRIVLCHVGHLFRRSRVIS
eukprot:Rmarinus@m.1008